MEVRSINLTKEVLIALLYIDKTLVKISAKYLDYTNDFSFNLIMELPENTSINKYTIKLKKG